MADGVKEEMEDWLPSHPPSSNKYHWRTGVGIVGKGRVAHNTYIDSSAFIANLVSPTKQYSKTLEQKSSKSGMMCLHKHILQSAYMRICLQASMHQPRNNQRRRKLVWSPLSWYIHPREHIGLPQRWPWLPRKLGSGTEQWLGTQTDTYSNHPTVEPVSSTLLNSSIQSGAHTTMNCNH